MPAGFTTPVEAVSIWRRPLIAAGEFTAQSAAGVIAATRRGSIADIGSTVLCLLGVSMPNFLLAVFLVAIGFWLQ